MADSQALALLADPNKVDVPKPKDDEVPSGVELGGTSSNSSPPLPKQEEKPSSTNVIDLLEETQFNRGDSKLKPLAESKSKKSDEPQKSEEPKNVFDLSDIQVNESSSAPEPPQLTLEQIREKKERILYDIERLRRRGVRFPRSFTMASDLAEMEAEYNRIKKDLETEAGIRFQRKMMMTVVSGLEMMNNRFDPFDIQLDGWSESVNENIGDYDDVFEELYEKYRGSGKMAPELRLLFMLGGSALMFHMTKSMFSSAAPQVSDILRQNPNLAAQMSQAAQQQMGGQASGLANLMGLAQAGGGTKSGGGGSGVQSASATPPPPRGVSVPPPQNVDDVLAELQGGSGGSNGKRGGRGSFKRGKKGGASVDTLSFSLNH